MENIQTKCVQTLRFLAADEVEKGEFRPSRPAPWYGAAYVYVLGQVHEVQSGGPELVQPRPLHPVPGHGSALLYAMLYLAGYGLTLDELKEFRQWGSRTPGHPEYGVTPGVDLSTGPLGHGLSMGVGFAIAETMLAAKYNKPDFPIVDHYTYGIVSDGDLMEGAASEAASLAGTLGLGKIIYMYDDNKITIEGTTDIAFTEDVETRFRAYHWQVLRVDSSKTWTAWPPRWKKRRRIRNTRA